MTRYLFYMRFSFFWGGGGGWGRGVVTGFKIVTTIVAKSRDTLNTITSSKVLRSMHATSDKNLLVRFDLAEIIFKLNKKNKTLHIRSKIIGENMKSDKNVEICTKRYKR